MQSIIEMAFNNDFLHVINTRRARRHGFTGIVVGQSGLPESAHLDAITLHVFVLRIASTQQSSSF